ncbi:TPA: RNA-binding cell elongation regulator Jag/EloR [Streptococcus pyogenes]|uniref:RNA-binding protein KhpB n=2 Tax=Streptococcus pyogenes TaxID=1314 RepID=A0A5S4TK32_STRPY|nr:RNA-binding cell elongation regulator Jag/EloR [Streptococcus pyogenes]ERL23214.1 KH domain protein [Streptococcus pyogenes GA06023]HEP6168472.1 protein jag [Streptococcus pyogenes ABC020047934]HEP6170143.1 protein jag [Streptococcus pyogenes ABC020030174]HEP6171917.1 protein jag [Streptococcus pyogenes ABC020055614]HEP6173732.1 protein jag [Streptococcus pyogenes ABC020026425]HEP6177233.1 protein jag [Streptococcus pyogenes ABC020015306]HEP6179208.1 protein jag [Streptococcus pyogenes AB
MVLFTGKTVEEAIETGLQELGLPRLKAHIKVISKEKKGFLGFGKKPAQVDIEGISDKTVYKADKKATRGVPEDINRQNAPAVNSADVEPEEIKATQRLEAEDTKVVPLMSEDSPAQIPSNLAETVTETKAQQPSIPVEESEVPQDAGNDGFSKDIEKAAQEVSDYVTKIIYEMDIEATVETSNNRRQINLQIETPEAGRVIGYHGKVLKSLQLLAQNFLHDRYSKNFSVSLNVHDYVEHRTETLIDFTQKVAKRVLESGQDYTMDPMSNSERKIVHKTVSSIEGVDSYSEGNDPNRYVVVSLQR